MPGITALGAYIPIYRLKREEIARMWRTRSGAEQKAVAGFDEDAVTMAVAAVRECVKGNVLLPDALYFACTTAPYREKQCAAIIASAMGVDRNSVTADFANSLKAGTTALMSALDAVKAGSATKVLVAAADCRLGAPKGLDEQLFGDAAACLAVGREGVIAEVESSYRSYSDFSGAWRTNTDRFVKSGERRFIDNHGYHPTMLDTIGRLLKANSLRPGDFSKVVFSAANTRAHTKLARTLGFKNTQVQDPLFERIGNAGTAAIFIMLIAAMAGARPGDRILVANYGDGADALVLRVTEAATAFQSRLDEQLKHSRSIDYGTYLNWRDLMPLDAPSLPPRGDPSLSSRWRERQTISNLTGVQCQTCGLPQIHPIGQRIRICVGCQSKDNFKPYGFSEKKASLFTYAVDHLQPTKNPPGLNGAIDFEGGGRLICELTDYDLDRVEIGMPLEMTFRKLSQGEGIINYFWKAKPITK